MQKPIFIRYTFKAAGKSITFLFLFQFTPLMCASQNGHTEILSYLMKNMADINAKSKHQVKFLDNC